ncbi:hypothetical protein CWB96_03115 [Pseudoalteromonas citrea]|uniref:Uncharacterized protein n=2 Tax=Pseudoalteromonas citrea TaxID=43655 RepID=A0A5S3XW62_9GAMM|nr:hypothetical protein [Pseudoalteromonas citrea]KAF7769917.1 hypothetical protein PCIT_a2842 [Pseudoalteromonas citrea]TMP40499.1 hypothetical protein CWB97_18115 [Pseudoalteromonas citrea]TMP61791.1 hypothetical protein CWB96_03115 [Pseudoalteromonas citrea]
MKLTLNKKQIKTLINEKSDLNLDATPQVAGGRPKSWWGGCGPSMDRFCYEESLSPRFCEG